MIVGVRVMVAVLVGVVVLVSEGVTLGVGEFVGRSVDVLEGVIVVVGATVLDGLEVGELAAGLQPNNRPANKANINAWKLISFPGFIDCDPWKLLFPRIISAC